MTTNTTAERICDLIHGAGGRALYVGGWVRDHRLGLEATDIDIEIFGVASDRLVELLRTIGPVDTVGRAFAVHKLNGVDVSIPRRESKTGPGHRGFSVTGDPGMSVQEAARRRDFTINAMAWDPRTRELIDPFGGAADLHARRLRVVDPATFADDSLRVLRGMQLAARFGLTADDATVRLFQDIPLDDLPAERIRDEVAKLLEAPKPSTGLELARRTGVTRKLFPELHRLIGCPQDPLWHPEGDVWTHTLMVVDAARRLAADLEPAKRLALMLAALCHDLGKPSTTAEIDGRIRARGHEAAGVTPARTLLDRLRMETVNGYPVRRQVLALVADHLAPAKWHEARDEVTDGAFRRLSRKVDMELMSLLGQADCEGRATDDDCAGRQRWFLERSRKLDVEHGPPKPILMGRHLLDAGLAPGPTMGRILKTVYDRQLNGEIRSLEDAIHAGRELAGLAPAR